MRPGDMLRALLLAAALSAVALGARAPELEQRSPAAQQLAAELGELQQHLAAHNGARAGRVRPSVTDLAEAGVTLSKMSALLSKVAAGPYKQAATELLEAPGRAASRLRSINCAEEGAYIAGRVVKAWMGPVCLLKLPFNNLTVQHFCGAEGNYTVDGTTLKTGGGTANEAGVNPACFTAIWYMAPSWPTTACDSIIAQYPINAENDLPDNWTAGAPQVPAACKAALGIPCAADQDPHPDCTSQFVTDVLMPAVGASFNTDQSYTGNRAALEAQLGRVCSMTGSATESSCGEDSPMAILSKLSRRYNDKPGVSTCPVSFFGTNLTAGQLILYGDMANLACIKEDNDYCLPKVLGGASPFTAMQSGPPTDTALYQQMCDPCVYKYMEGACLRLACVQGCSMRIGNGCMHADSWSIWPRHHAESAHFCRHDARPLEDVGSCEWWLTERPGPRRHGVSRPHVQDDVRSRSAGRLLFDEN